MSPKIDRNREPSTVEREDDKDGGRYALAVEGAVSELTYRWRDDRAVMVANHTYTPPEARGKGTAARLVERIVQDARTEGFKIDPTCPYVAVWFDRHGDAADVRI